MSKVMSWSTNWPTKVNPDVSFGLGFSLAASLWLFVTVAADNGLFLHGRAQAVEERIRSCVLRLALEHEPEATLSRGVLRDQIHPPQLAPCGGIEGSGRPPPVPPRRSPQRQRPPCLARRRLYLSRIRDD